MENNAWERNADETLELWDRFIWVLAQWWCQSRGHAEVQKSDDHIVRPDVHNEPCEPCYFELAAILDPDLFDLMGVFGARAYQLGKEGVPEHEAAGRVLTEVVERLVRGEAAKALLAHVGGENAWWKLPLEQDERGG